MVVCEYVECFAVVVCHDDVEVVLEGECEGLCEFYFVVDDQDVVGFCGCVGIGVVDVGFEWDCVVVCCGEFHVDQCVFVWVRVYDLDVVVCVCDDFVADR